MPANFDPCGLGSKIWQWSVIKPEQYAISVRQLVASAVALSVRLLRAAFAVRQFAVKKEPFDARSILLVAATSQGNAQVVKQGPFDGKIVPGSILLVDDGTCSKGRIKQVTGGEIGAMNPRPRTRKCIPRLQISQLTARLRAVGTRTGAVYNGFGIDQTDEQWTQHAIELAAEVEVDRAIVPDLAGTGPLRAFCQKTSRVR